MRVRVVPGPRARTDGALELDGLPDGLLVEELRRGTRDAGLVLWRRHVEVARAVATSVVDDAEVAESVLRRAFAHVLDDVAAGADAISGLPAHLRTSVLLGARLLRSDAPEPALLRAFRTLDRLDQRVLWAALVDGDPHLGVALATSTRPEDVGVLVGRAEVRLHTAWLDQLRLEEQPSETCWWVTSRSALLRHGLRGPEATERYLQHLRGCEACATFVVDEGRFPLDLLDVLLPRR